MNGLRFLACLKLIFEFWGRFSLFSVCFFEQQMWGDGRRKRRRCEGQKVRGLGLFCRPWAAARGFIPAPVLWLGSTPLWGHLGSATPRIHPWENTSGLCFSDSSSWDRTLGKAGMTQAQIPGLRAVLSRDFVWLSNLTWYKSGKTQH